MSFAPIIVPILLMGLQSALAIVGIKAPLIMLLGTPSIAIAVGVILATGVLFQSTLAYK